jgi:predicted outer membrane repeat protein
VTNSTFSGNSASSGGAIYSEGTVAVMNSTFSGNLATNGDGAGVENFGTLTVTNSTFSGNTATFSGGGIDNFGTLRLTNSTFSGNSANTGGGIYNNVTATLYNNIIANSTSGGDCVQAGGTLTVGVNLIGDGSCNATISGNPSLGTLQNNGGPTQTFALNAGSPAIDAGDSTALSEATTVVDYNGDGDTTDTIQFDQRGTGFPRVQGSRVDLGAVEVQCAGSPYNVLAGDVSGLIAAINCANSTPANDEINLTNSTYTLTAVNNSDGGAGDNGLPGILSAGTAGTLTINGNGAIIERNAIPSFRLMYIDSGANLTLDNLTLRGGRGSGGGVLQQGYGEPAKRYTLQ